MNDQQERAAFEAAMREIHGDRGLTQFTPERGYGTRVHEWWVAWQARAALAAAPQVPEAVAVGKMTAQRAKFFLQRFKLTEKLLGPNEQAGLDYAIAALEREQYAAPRPAECVRLTPQQLGALMSPEYDNAESVARAEFISGFRCAEIVHGIKPPNAKVCRERSESEAPAGYGAKPLA